MIIEKDLKKELIEYFKTLGIEVYTTTKARGHQGFYLKNRIDISKHTKPQRVVPTLLHEFAHFIHEKLESDISKTGGSLDVLFDLKTQNKVAEKKQETFHPAFCQGGKRKKFFNPCFENLNLFKPFQPQKELEITEKNEESLDISKIEKELLAVTNFVDDNSHFAKLKQHKNQVKEQLKHYETLVKVDYPNFMRSKKFLDFDRYIKKSKAKYLLKYDRVKVLSPFLKREEVFSVENLEQDFPDMPRAFRAYLRLVSCQRKQARISRRINKLSKYYQKPTELFSRLVEGLYIDRERTKALAPQATQRFFELLSEGYYFELKNVFALLGE